MSFQVFLSHSSAEKAAVEEIARRLLREGIEAWLDKWHLIPGDPWQPAIEKALAESESCVDLLVHDVRNQPGALPLLQHALLELWNNREGRRLTVKGYQEIGKLEGALQKRADATLKPFSEDEREFCRRIFLRLTQPGGRNGRYEAQSLHTGATVIIGKFGCRGGNHPEARECVAAHH